MRTAMLKIDEVLCFAVLLSAWVASGALGSEPWLPLPFGSGGWVTCVAVDPHLPGTVFAGCDIGGVYKSTDYGDTWRIVNKGLDKFGYQCVATIAVDPVRKDTLYIGVGTWFGAYKPGQAGAFGGVYKSVDGGETLRATFGWGKLHFACDVLSIAVDGSTDPATLYAATSRPDGIFKSVDGGETWARLTNGLPDDDRWSGQDSGEYAVVRIDPRDARVVYAGGRHGILRSDDKGESWQKLPGGGLPDGFCCRGILMAPKAPQVLYTRGDGRIEEQGIYKSTDGGATWKSASANLPFVYQRQYRIFALAMDPNDPHALYAGQAARGVWRSVDGGESWENVLPEFSCCGLAVDPVDGAVYAGAFVYWYDRTRQGLRKSDDRGRTWTALDISGLGHGNIRWIVADPHVRGRLVVGVSGNGVFMGTPGELK